MSFTTQCFIRKNTLELRNKLMLLGYRQSDTGYKDTDGVLVTTMSEFCSDDRKGEPLFAQTREGCVRGVFHCGTNEDLFLALAALRDDTSAGQYWVFDEDFGNYRKGDFIMGSFHRCSCYCHKATVSELVEYFKTEKP